jgi:hypothetical protein
MPRRNRLRIQPFPCLAGFLGELRHRQLFRGPEHRPFQFRRVLVGEAGGLVDQDGRVPVADVSGVEHREGGGQGVDQVRADPDQGLHGPVREAQQAGQFRHQDAAGDVLPAQPARCRSQPYRLIQHRRFAEPAQLIDREGLFRGVRGEAPMRRVHAGEQVVVALLVLLHASHFTGTHRHSNRTEIGSDQALCITRDTMDLWRNRAVGTTTRAVQARI